MIHPRMRSQWQPEHEEETTHCPVLFITYFLHPGYRFAIHCATHRQVGHGRVRRSTVPMFDIGRAPHDITFTDDLHGLSPFLRQSDA